jgi:hypothetical protein
MSKQNSSGFLRLEHTDIVYSSDKKELWRLPLSKVRAIGEYTTANGPFVDDYFLVFVADQCDCWYEASYYAQGNDAFRVSLGKLLGDEIRFGLNNSTDWKHRVLWPKKLEGTDLFNVIPETKAKNLAGKLKQKVFPRKTLELAKLVCELRQQ